MERTDLFNTLKVVLNELEIVWQPKKYFQMSNNKLKSLIIKYNEQLEDYEENQDYRIYRAI